MLPPGLGMPLAPLPGLGWDRELKRIWLHAGGIPLLRIPHGILQRVASLSCLVKEKLGLLAKMAVVGLRPAVGSE